MVPGNSPKKLVEDPGIRRNDITGIEKILASFRVRNQPPGLPDEQRTGCHIPYFQSKFPETIHAACRDISQIECGRTGAPDSSGTPGEHPERLGPLIQAIEFSEREPRAQKCRLEMGAGTDADSSLTQLCSLATAGGKELVSQGVINHTVLNRPILENSN